MLNTVVSFISDTIQNQILNAVHNVTPTGINGVAESVTDKQWKFCLIGGIRPYRNNRKTHYWIYRRLDIGSWRGGLETTLWNY